MLGRLILALFAQAGEAQHHNGYDVGQHFVNFLLQGQMLMDGIGTAVRIRQLCSGWCSRRTRGGPGGALPPLLNHMGPRGLTEQAKGGPDTDELLHTAEGDPGL